MKQPVPFPFVFRVAILLAIAAGALVSFSAAQGVGASAIASSATPLPEVKLGWLENVTPYAKEQQAALQASQRATLGAIEGMGASRVLILLALSATASMVFMGALFIRWSSNAPRANLARLLGTAAFAAALFRTLDGAQELVIARHAAQAGVKALIAANVPDAAAGSGFTLGVISAVSVLWTAFVVGLFLFLGSYFRSDTVRGLLEATGGGSDDEG
jgi:hypothetical protein